MTNAVCLLNMIISGTHRGSEWQLCDTGHVKDRKHAVCLMK